MDTQPLSTSAALSHSQKSALKKGNILVVSDLLVLSSQDIGRRCRISHGEAQEIVNLVLDELPTPPLLSLDRHDLPQDETITTGDPILDKVLGGGFRTRKLWEVTGESAAGKTQLAMQLALCVQLPQHLGGASGSACFLSTSWTLPTHRLVEIINNHPALSSAVCGLAGIHTMKTPTIPLLLHVLSETFPALVQAQKAQPDKKPVKLLVIDAITELFRNDEMVSSATLADRSKSLQEIATLLHMLANKHGLAVVVLNEVSEVVDRPQPPSSRLHEVSYKEQARLFSRASTIHGENTKQAALGLVWANQVNARMMLTRTSRMRVLDDTEYRPTKRRRTADGLATPLLTRSDSAEPVRIRRLSVIFNSVAQPASLDYIVTASGFVALEVVEQVSVHDIVPVEEPQHPIPLAALEEVCPLDLPLAVNSSAGPSSDPSLPSSINVVKDAAVSLTDDDADASLEAQDAEHGPQDEDDEWEAYWKDDDLFSDIYTQVNLDTVTRSA